MPSQRQRPYFPSMICIQTIIHLNINWNICFDFILDKFDSNIAFIFHFDLYFSTIDHYYDYLIRYESILGLFKINSEKVFIQCLYSF